MDESQLKSQAVAGFIWQFLQKISSQLFSFIVTVILARLLLPSDYGVVALAGMFNVLVGILINGSMDASLIQKKNADELDYNTVFYSSLFMSFVVYAIVFFCAPYFAHFYGNEQITSIMRVLALGMPIGVLAMVQNAIVSKKLQFKKFFVSGILGQLFSAVVGIYMAYHGFGPWALVAQSLISLIANTVVMFFLVSWHPRWMFSFDRFRGLFSFAWKKTAAGFIGTLCGQLKGYLIGYKYSMSDLAYFNRGDGLPGMISNNIQGSINAVLFPALSRVNNDTEAVKRGVRRSLMVSSYVLTPMFLGLAATADKIVPMLYSERWAPAIPFMQVACLIECVSVLNAVNVQALFALGHSDDVLRLEIYKKPFMLLVIAISIFISPLAISVGMFIYSFYGLLFNAIPVKRRLNYSLVAQLNDVKHSLLLSFLMMGTVYGVGLLIPNIYVSLFCQVLFGATFYILVSSKMKIEAYLYTKDIVGKMLASKFPHIKTIKERWT